MKNKNTKYNVMNQKSFFNEKKFIYYQEKPETVKQEEPETFKQEEIIGNDKTSPAEHHQNNVNEEIKKVLPGVIPEDHHFDQAELALNELISDQSIIDHYQKSEINFEEIVDTLLGNGITESVAKRINDLNIRTDYTQLEKALKIADFVVKSKQVETIETGKEGNKDKYPQLLELQNKYPELFLNPAMLEIDHSSLEKLETIFENFETNPTIEASLKIHLKNVEPDNILEDNTIKYLKSLLASIIIEKTVCGKNLVTIENIEKELEINIRAFSTNNQFISEKIEVPEFEQVIEENTQDSSKDKERTFLRWIDEKITNNNARPIYQLKKTA